MSARRRRERDRPRGRAAIPAPSSAALVDRLTVAAAAVITLIATLHHFEFWRHAGALWRDEVSTVDLAGLAPGPAFAHALRFDSFPPFAMVALRGWMALGLGGSDFALRGFGFAVGLAAILAVWIAGRALGLRAPVLALALYAAHPTAVLYGDALRPHGLGAVLIVLAVAAFARATAAPSARAWLLAALASLAAAHTLYPNVFLVAGLAAGAVFAGVLARDRVRVIAPFAILVLTLISLLPDVSAIRFAAELAPVIRPPGDPIGLATAFTIAVGRGVPGLAAAWMVVAGAGLALLAWRAARGAKAAWLAVALLVGAGGFLLFLTSSGLSAKSWYFLPLLAIVALAAEAGVAAVPLAGTALARVLLAVGVAIAAWGPAREIARLRQTDVDRVARTLAAQAAPGDLVVVTPWYYGITYQRYAGPAPWTTLPGIADLTLTRWDLLRARMLEPDPVTAISARATAALRAGHRVWIAGNPPSYRVGAPRPVLPPPPHAAWGWSSDPYTDGWSLQLAHDLYEAGGRAESVPVDEGDTVLERAFLFRIQIPVATPAR